MPRRTTAGTLQVNLTIESDAYALLKRYAPTKKAYGHFLGQLLKEYAWSRQHQAFEQRLEKLEKQIGALATR